MAPHFRTFSANEGDRSELYSVSESPPEGGVRATSFALVDQVQRIVAGRWLAVLRQHGTSEAECDRLAPAFNYPGFELDPTAPPRHDEPQTVLLARKYRVPLDQAEAMNARMAGEAAKEGLTFHLDRVQVGNTFDAHRVLHLAATHDRREALVERLFAAYLAEGEALSDHRVLVRLASDAGLDPGEVQAALEIGRFADNVRSDEARAHALGITGVPFFAIAERYGISGAQSPEVILETLQQAWQEQPTAVTTAV